MDADPAPPPASAIPPAPAPVRAAERPSGGPGATAALRALFAIGPTPRPLADGDAPPHP